MSIEIELDERELELIIDGLFAIISHPSTSQDDWRDAADLSDLNQIGAPGGPQIFDVSPSDIIRHNEFDPAAPAGKFENINIKIVTCMQTYNFCTEFFFR